MCESDDDSVMLETPQYIINDILELIRCASSFLVEQTQENKDEFIDQLERVISQLVVGP